MLCFFCRLRVDPACPLPLCSQNDALFCCRWSVPATGNQFLEKVSACGYSLLLGCHDIRVAGAGAVDVTPIPAAGEYSLPTVCKKEDRDSAELSRFDGSEG